MDSTPTPAVAKRFRLLRSLVQYKHLTDDQLMVLAVESVAKSPGVGGGDDPKPSKPAELDVVDRFKVTAEKNLARSLVKKYLTDYQLESIGELNTLQEIVYLEVIQVRLQDKLNELYDNDTKAFSFDVLGTIHKNSDVIMKLKDSLGLGKMNDKEDDYSAWQSLLKRFGQWRTVNQASRQIKCPHCTQFIWLKMRTAAWEALKHPFFQDTFLCNKPLLEALGQTVTIDAPFIAKVFGTSPDYIQWVLERIRKPATEQSNEEIKNTTDHTPSTDTAQPDIAGTGVATGTPVVDATRKLTE